MTKFSGNIPSVKTPARQLRVLVAPLDWGLGHATRCIPVIYELQKQCTDVWLAGEKAQEQLLRTEFPDLPFLPLQGYRVRYASSASGLSLALLSQAPGLWRSVLREKKWLARMIEQHQFDIVISDNRFGLSHHSLPCIFITHQLAISTSMGKWADRLAQRLNYRFIGKFNECWVPDHRDEPSLAGLLSHPRVSPPIPVRYPGLLSRLIRADLQPEPGTLFISLSGPEPQRTIWENRIVDEIAHYQGRATILRGLPGTGKHIPSTNDILFFNHLPSAEYGTKLEKAEWVICRSGYSTVMDLARMGKKAVLVPTPGQPEQEYLARHLSETGFAPFISQEEFSITKALQAGQRFEYRQFDHSGSSLPELVTDLIGKAAMYQTDLG